MSNIPFFKSTSHQDAYYDIFEENLAVYSKLMTKVRQEFFNLYEDLSGEHFTNIRKITESLINTTNKEFTAAYTQYNEKQFLRESNNHEVTSLNQISLGD